MPQLFETRDPNVADDLVRQQYTSVRMRGRDEHFRLRIESEQLDTIRLDRTTFGLSLDYRAAPMGGLTIAHARSGSAVYQFGHDAYHRGRGDVFLVAPPDAKFHGTVDHLEADFANFDPELLTDVAAGAPGTSEPVRLLGLDPVSPRAAARWRHAFGAVRAVNGGPDPTPPLVAAHAARFLAAVTLTVFPSTALTDPTATDRHDAHPDTVRRAIAFMEQAPQRDITIADIAGAAHVTVRAVQLAFRRHLDTTPMAYLRRLRLEGARDELAARSPRDTTVTAVASRWGFANPGTFAQHYRQAFNELPSHTLAR